MTTRKKIVIGLATVIALWVTYGLVDFFIYPLSSGDKPTFKDVEQTFNKIPVPDSWVEIRSSENPGISHGRICWIENETTCFHKSKVYKVTDSKQYDIEGIIVNSTQCTVIDKDKPSKSANTDFYSLTCALPDRIEINANFGGANNEVYIGVIGTPSSD
jgi:hypothetical protein